MPERPDRQTVDIRDFGGVELASDAHDLEPGTAQDQVNAMSDQVGALRVRLGCVQVSFEG